MSAQQAPGDVSTERHDREFWEGAARQVDAGQSVRAVAERLGVRPKTLSWWRWRLERDQPARPHRTKRAQERPTFLPVVLDAATMKRGALELEIGDARLRIEPGADVDYVVALVVSVRPIASLTPVA